MQRLFDLWREAHLKAHDAEMTLITRRSNGIAPEPSDLARIKELRAVEREALQAFHASCHHDRQACCLAEQPMASSQSLTAQSAGAEDTLKDSLEMHGRLV